MFEKDKQEHVMDGHTVEVRKEVGYEYDMERKKSVSMYTDTVIFLFDMTSKWPTDVKMRHIRTKK